MAARQFIALALVACLAVGCSDADSDDAELNDSSSPSSGLGTSGEPAHKDDASPIDDEEPDLPNAARADSLKGAEAFIRHYVNLRNYAADTGDVSAFRAASDACEGCEKYANLYKRTYEAGGYIRSSGWRPTSVDVVEQGRGVTVALVTVEAPRMRFSRTDSDESHIGRGGTYKLRFELLANLESWMVTDFGVQTDADDI